MPDATKPTVPRNRPKPHDWEGRAARALRTVDRHQLSRHLSRWLGRGVARLRLRRIGVWYHQDYAGSSLALVSAVPHVDLQRGQKVLDSLEERGLLRERDVIMPSPVPLSVLLAVHTADYLERVTEPAYLARIFGLDALSVDVDTVLQSQRRAAGGTYEATRWAIARAGRLAFNLGGGFHHAEQSRGAGFCVYNDVAATIEDLRAGGFASPIAIVDLDYHQGNGNAAIFADDASVLTYSLHGAVWAEGEARSDLDVLVPSGADSDIYLEALRRSLPAALGTHQPGLIFYIAGTDVLAHDALGDLNVSMSGALDRDRLVIEWARANDCSTVVVMGGGYSKRAWRSTANMLEWALTGRDSRVLDEDVIVRRRFGRIAHSLDPFELQQSGDDSPLTDADLLMELDGAASSSLLLGYYSVHGVELAFERYGFLGKLREKGFTDIRLDIDPSDLERQRVRIYGQKVAGDFHLLVELLLRRRSMAAPASMRLEEPLEFISVEWLLIQDPTASFTPGRRRLPGQRHPGLGVLRELMEMLHQACLRLDLDGVIAHPSHFHISAVGANHFVFLDPMVQGRFDALREQEGLGSMREISRLLDDKRLRDEEGGIVEWQPVDFIAPVSERLREYFDSTEYRELRESARASAHAVRIRDDTAAGR